MQTCQRAKYLSDPIAVPRSPAEPRRAIRRRRPKRLARVSEVRELWILLQARKHTYSCVRHDELERPGGRGIGHNARLRTTAVLVDIVLEFAQGAKHCRRVAARETSVHRGLLGAARPKIPLALIVGCRIMVAEPIYAGTSAKLGAASGPAGDRVAREMRKRCIERGPRVGVRVRVRRHRHLNDWPNSTGPQDADLSNRQQPTAFCLPEQVVGGPEIPHDVPGSLLPCQVAPFRQQHEAAGRRAPSLQRYGYRRHCVTSYLHFRSGCPPKSSTILGVVACV
jgi:hypothetical protein